MNCKKDSVAAKIVEALLDDSVPPHFQSGDAEARNATRSPFTAWEYATRTRRHDPALWQVIQGSPYERQYRQMFNL